MKIISREQEQEIKRLIESGLKPQEIAKCMGLCKETILRRCRALGIKPSKGITKPFSIDNLPEDLLQLIIGSLLGDGSFTKACPSAYCLSIVHGEKQLSYLKFKESILKKYNLASGINICSSYDKRYGHAYTSCKLKSRTNNVFREIRDKYYKGKGKYIINTEIFEKLSPLGLAIWYLDDGYVTKHSCIFSTVSIPLETQVKLADIMQKKFDLHFTVGHNDNSMYLCASDFSKLKNLISSYVPEDLKYKLEPYRHRVLNKSDELLESCDANQQPSLGSA